MNPSPRGTPVLLFLFITTMTQTLDVENSKEILYLLLERPLRFKDIKSSLRGMTNATLTRRLEQLLKVNLIQCVPNLADKSWEYTLTDTGRNVVENLLSETQNLKDKFRAVLPAITVKL